MIRLTINRKMDESRMFAVWRIFQPWKSITKKGQGHRMGGGKGAIDHWVYPLRAGRIVVEMGGHCEFEEVKKILTQVRKRLLPLLWTLSVLEVVSSKSLLL
jgi:large subunit ribosomal protein L16